MADMSPSPPVNPADMEPLGLDPLEMVRMDMVRMGMNPLDLVLMERHLDRAARQSHLNQCGLGRACGPPDLRTSQPQPRDLPTHHAWRSTPSPTPHPLASDQIPANPGCRYRRP